MQKAKIIRINRWNRDRPGGHVEGYLSDTNFDPYPPFRVSAKKASRKKQRRQAKKIIEEALIMREADQEDLMYEEFESEHDEYLDAEYQKMLMDEYYYDLECQRELEYIENMNDDFYYDWEYDYD